MSGQVLDERYRVIEPIGEGAMGSVYRGERLKLGRMVAIKVLNDEIPNESSRLRFEREAEAMAKLEHPNCGSVLDVGVHEDRPYVVMELVSGENLKDVLARGLLPIPRAVEITRQVLSGLSHAHGHGIIHRDIKPANIVLSQKAGFGDHVKLLDFGLARFTQKSSNLTGAMVLGTPGYMAPEQVCGLELDHRVDLYACGVLLYELLTGEKPFQAADPIAVCMQHVNADPPKLADRAPGRVFGVLEGIVSRALEKDREKRFSSADEFARALVEAAARLDDTAPNPPQPAETLAMPPTASASARTRSASPAPTTALPPAPSPTTVLPPTRSPTPAPSPTAVFSPTHAPASPTTALPPAPSPTPAPPSAVSPPTPPTPSPTPAPPSAVSPPTPPTPSTAPTLVKVARPKHRTLAIAAGVIATVGVVVAVVLASRSDAKPPPAPVAAPAAVDAATIEESQPEGDPVASILTRAADLAAAGRREAAIDFLLDARKTYPKDARLPYEASKLYLDKMWKADGLKLARTAIDLDARYKTDAELIKLVVRLYNTTASRDWTLANFLHDDIGEAAKPFLEDTAKGHPNPIVRKRAAAELRRY